MSSGSPAGTTLGCPMPSGRKVAPGHCTMLNLHAIARPVISLSCRPDADLLVAELAGDGRLVVRGPSDGGGWARVIRNDSLTLVALAPFLPDGTRARADAVVPTGLGLDDLRIDRTDHPLPGPGGPVDLTVRARMLGRAAAGQAAVGNKARAAELWSTCADAWSALGDDVRADMARRRVDTPFQGRPPATSRRRRGG